MTIKQANQSWLWRGGRRFSGRGLAFSILALWAWFPCAAWAQQPKDAPPPPKCVALVLPDVQGVPGNAADVAAGVRELMSSYLAGPSLKAISLEARLPSQAAEEARQKSCEQLLFVKVTRKPGGGSGFMKVLGGASGAASWHLPGGSGAEAAVRAGAGGALSAISTMASSTKKKDELSLEYRLQSPGGEVLLGPKMETRSAKVDGEDVLTPVVARVAEAIVSRRVAQ